MSFWMVWYIFTRFYYIFIFSDCGKCQECVEEDVDPGGKKFVKINK